MSDIEQKRIYADRREATVLYVAGQQGVATVWVSGDRVGRFGIAHRCRARDVAARDGTVYVATDEGVLAGPDPFDPLGFDGGAVAVAASDAGVFAASETGELRRLRDDAWTTPGAVDEVRALSGAFVAAGEGVFRVRDGELVGVGLADVRDVAAGGTPLAATGDGLYRLGNGWLSEREGAFEVVGAAPGDDRAHAATADALYACGDDWTAVDLPVAEPVVDVGYGECTYAVTASGTVLVAADPDRTADGTGGWRSRALGLTGVEALAVTADSASGDPGTGG